MPNNSGTNDKKQARGSSSTDGEYDQKIRTKLCSIQDRIDSGFSRMDNELETLKSDLKSDIRAVKKELSDVSKSLEAIWTEVDELKGKNKSLQKQLDDKNDENGKLNEEVSALKTRLVKQEDYSRRENLRMYNIPEDARESNEECVNKVKDVLAELGAAPEDIMFHAIHRTGKPNSSRKDTTASSNRTENTGSQEDESRLTRPRAVLVRFVSRMDSDWVWEMRRELSKSPRFSSVFIDKDLSAESAKERAQLRAALRKAKELNTERAFIKGKKLIVNSSTYTVETLPEFLLPERKAKDQPVN